jgi:hypothetical protein
MADATVIQCPTCSKKFKLPENPPAVFTCTGCKTPMDLSGFRPADAAPAAPEATTTSSRSAGTPSRAAGRASARSGARSGARAAAAAAPPPRPSRTARGARAREDEDEDEGADRGPPPRKKSNGPIIAALIGFVVLGGIVFLIVTRKGDSGTVAKKTPVVQKPVETAPVAPPPVEATAPVEAPPPPKPPQGQVHEIGHHPDATADEQKKIDELIDKAVFQDLGRDSTDAGKELVTIGQKSMPRLINVFATVNAKEGLGTLEGNKKAAIADGLLRRIDGYQERVRKVRQPIRPVSDKDFVVGVARGWNLYWDKEFWKKEPNKPWDPRVDETDEK